MVAVAGLSMLVAGCAPAARTTGLARSMGWVAQQSGTGNDLVGVCFTSANDGWAVGEAGMLLATSDGGAHWRSVSPAPGRTSSPSPSPTGHTVGCSATMR